MLKSERENYFYQEKNEARLDEIVVEVLRYYEMLPLPNSAAAKTTATNFTNVINKRKVIFDQIMQRHNVDSMERARINAELGKRITKRKK